MSGLLPDTPAGWGGYGLAAIAALVAWIRDRRKSDIDESALVLGKWKELVEQHQSDIKGIREEFATYKTMAIAEIADLRARLQASDTRSAALEKRVSELETENAGLKRAIAQNSQSTAFQLRRTRDGGDAAEDMTEKLDRAGHNLRGSTE